MDDDESLQKLILSRWTAFRRRNNSSCNWRCCYFGFPPPFFFAVVVLVASKIYSDFFSGLLAVPPTRPSGHPSLCVMNFYCDGAFGFTSWLSASHFPHFPLTSYADFPLLPSQGGCALSWLLHIHDLYLGHKESMGRNGVSLLLMLLLLRLLFILMALPRAQINITHFWPPSTPLLLSSRNLCMTQSECIPSLPSICRPFRNAGDLPSVFVIVK